MKSAKKTAHWGIFYEFFCTDVFENTFECILHDVRCLKNIQVVSTFFELHLLCYFAPLKHFPEAIELSEELCKVLGQLPCTFSFRRTRSCLRRLRSEFKGALLTILMFEDLAIRAGGPLIDVLMLHYVCSCCEEPFGVDFVEIGSSVN